MSGNLQFGRYVEVEIRDFDSNVKTVIGNEFEIEFEYFKTLDQTKEDDSGTIRIFGLTPERVKSLQVNGGEVRLHCGYINSSISTLFVASIVRLYSNNVENTTVTTIECSANLLHYYVNGSGSSGLGGGQVKSIESFMNEMLYSLGFNRTLFVLNDVPENRRKDVEEYLKTFALSLSVVGNAETVLTSIMTIFGFGMLVVGEGNDKVVNIAVLPLAVDKILKSIDGGYAKVGVVPEPITTSENYQKNRVFYSTLKADDDDGTITILDYETGLIESKTEYKIATAYVDQDIYSDDEETLSSQNQRANAATRDSKRAASESIREQKAKEAGKPFKPKKIGVKRDTIKVNRRYNRVKALLNPLVRPQSMVAVFDSSDSEADRSDIVENAKSLDTENQDVTAGSYQKLRVRNATYKGNNKRNDWIMDLYCEDSERSQLTDEEVRAIASTNSSEDVEIVQKETSEIEQ